MCLTNYIKVLIGSATILTLTTLVSVNSLAETATSGNLLTNAGDGLNTNTQNSNSTIDGMNSSSGFTLNGITDYSSNYNELEAQGTGTVSAPRFTCKYYNYKTIRQFTYNNYNIFRWWCNLKCLNRGTKL